MAVNVIAALWGFAEATLFFIVPDVGLSVAGRNQLKRGLVACGYALAGAVLGGVVTYVWAVNDAPRLLALMERLPAISPSMVDGVRAALDSQGALAIFNGPLQGVPYKLYAAQAPGAGVGIAAFVLVSIPARLLRFVLITVASHYALAGLQALGLRLPRIWMLLTAWCVFYVAYFLAMPG